MKKLTILIIAIAFLTIGNIYAQQRPAVPEWVETAVFYQIYPQTFNDTDADGIGDLQGIINKLDYIKSLGINAIWLSPFYKSPFHDAGYDVSDFYKVAPRYGKNDIAKELFAEANKRDIKVIVDFVVGHTSIEHEWFKKSCNNAGKTNNWYIWTDDAFSTPKEYTHKFVQGYADRNGSYMTNFFWCQPKLNFGWDEDEIKYDWQLPLNHPDVMALKKEMKNILKFWLDMGANGFRVDMAGSAGNDFWLSVRKMVDENYPEAFLVSEWGVPATAIEGGFHADFMHWFRGYDDLFHKKWFTKDETTCSFFEAEGKGNITEFLDAFAEQHNQLKDNGYISIPVDNHDMVRVKNWGRDDKDLEIIYAFQMTFPSIPFIYYGDEIGMRQLPLNNALAVEGSYGSRSGDRTPMQWNSEKNYGFSGADTDKLYLPQDDASDAPTVLDQVNDKNSLLNKTKQLIEIRKSEKSLLPYADFEVLYAKKNKYPFIYTRTLDKSKSLIVLNPSKEPITVKIPLKEVESFNLLMGEGIKLLNKDGYTLVECEGRSYGIYQLN